jgi:hypothetical protein
MSCHAGAEKRLRRKDETNSSSIWINMSSQTDLTDSNLQLMFHVCYTHPPRPLQDAGWQTLV